ncbi:hypothetical protein A2V49_03730 [candidate division WWE3 bacterium RBG_19FT_COMBO_34_6]|uniref:Uncharacterized protein n=1 Tax=candidate division WWE3 bacterium RBG_19FT_COMBO_34_6 TaxID=1802612 RepID=A0A1F4UKT6_UNCKA|nr:MAG: hypothetical protein A2V49_03730 [candidate division WWE3 bacterium RBG_19FT_COMBO_34_6]
MSIQPPEKGFTSSTGLEGWYGDIPPTKDQEIKEQEAQKKANEVMKNYIESRKNQQDSEKNKELKDIIDNLREGL